MSETNNLIIDQLDEITLDKEENTVASQFLLGELIKAATKQLKELAVTWRSMSQEEQEKVLEKVQDDCEAAVRKAVTCIATGNRVNFRAEVKSVQFLEKSEVKAQLIMFNAPEAHALADTAGRSVMVVIEDGSSYLEVGDALEGDPDQYSLLDGGSEDDIDAQANDELYDKAVTLVVKSRSASISSVQRHLRIGYNRAARLIDEMEQKGVVSAMESNGNRTVLAAA